MFVNISTYLFAPLSGLPELREQLRALCRAAELKGTIMLSPEGINLFVAGTQGNIDLLLSHLRAVPGLQNLTPKVSLSDAQPFRRIERVGVVTSKRSLTPFESATKEALGFLELALHCQQIAHVADRSERFWMITPMNPLTSLEITTKVGLSFLELALHLQQLAHDADRYERPQVIIVDRAAGGEEVKEEERQAHPSRSRRSHFREFFDRHDASSHFPGSLPLQSRPL